MCFLQSHVSSVLEALEELRDLGSIVWTHHHRLCPKSGRVSPSLVQQRNSRILTNRENASLNSDTCSSVRESAYSTQVVSYVVIITCRIELGRSLIARGEVGGTVSRTYHIGWYCEYR